MFTNKQSLYLTGIVVISFFICGLFGVLDHFITKLILGSLFILIVVNLFLSKKAVLEEEKDSSSGNSMKQ